MSDHVYRLPDFPLPPPSDPDPDFKPSWLFQMTGEEQDEYNRTGKKPERFTR